MKSKITSTLSRSTDRLLDGVRTPHLEEADKSFSICNLNRAVTCPALLLHKRKRKEIHPVGNKKRGSKRSSGNEDIDIGKGGETVNKIVGSLVVDGNSPRMATSFRGSESADSPKFRPYRHHCAHQSVRTSLQLFTPAKYLLIL